MLCFSIQAYNRINEKRSNVGSTAIKLVKDHIKTLNGEGEVKNWLRWSLRGDGPLFFKVPSPMGSPTDHTDPRYQVSQFFLVKYWPGCPGHLLIEFCSFPKVVSFLDSLSILPPHSLVSGLAQP